MVNPTQKTVPTPHSDGDAVARLGAALRSSVRTFGRSDPQAAPVPAATEDAAHLVGRKVSLFTSASREGDVMGIIPSCSIVLNSLHGHPQFRIQHTASGTTQECGGVSLGGGSFSFVSDEGLLIKVSGKHGLMEAEVGEPAATVIPRFSSREATPVKTDDAAARRSAVLSNQLLVESPSNVRLGDLGHGFFIMQGGAMFRIENRAVTNAGQGYILFYVDPQAHKEDRGFCLCFGHPTPDVPYARHFGLHVGEQREFGLGDGRVTVSLGQMGNTLLTDIRFY